MELKQRLKKYSKISAFLNRAHQTNRAYKAYYYALFSKKAYKCTPLSSKRKYKCTQFLVKGVSVYTLFSKQGVRLYAFMTKKAYKYKNSVNDLSCFSYHKKTFSLFYFLSVFVYLTESETFSSMFRNLL